MFTITSFGEIYMSIISYLLPICVAKLVKYVICELTNWRLLLVQDRSLFIVFINLTSTQNISEVSANFRNYLNSESNALAAYLRHSEKKGHNRPPAHNLPAIQQESLRVQNIKNDFLDWILWRFNKYMDIYVQTKKFTWASEQFLIHSWICSFHICN